MDLTLTALTAAVVTACFISTGVKEETPVFPTSTINSEAVADFETTHVDITTDIEIESSLGNFSFYFKHEDVEKLNTLYTHASLDYTYHTAQETTASNIVSSTGAIDIAPTLQAKRLINTAQSSGDFLSYHKSEAITATESLASSGYSIAAVFFYDLQCATAYFKTDTGTHPYFVYGYYNGKVVFGSTININIPNLSNSVNSAVALEHFFVKGIPAQTEHITTATPNIQTYVKDSVADGITHSVSTTLIARDPSNISPYRIVSSAVSSTDSSFGMLVYVKDNVVEDEVNTVSTQGALSLMPYKLASVVASTDSVGTIIPIGGLNIEEDNLLSSTLSNFSDLILHIVQGITHVENTTLSNTNGATLVFGSMLETEGHIESVNSFGTTSVFDVGPYRGEHDLLTTSTQQLYVKDTEVEHTNSVTTTGQSDIRFGDVILINRTETTITNLGNFKVVYNPGVEPVSNTMVTFGSNFNIVGENKEASSIVESISTNGTCSIQPYKLLETVENTATTEQVHLFYSHHEDVTVVVSSLYSDFATEFIIDKPVYKLQTVTTEATLHAVVKDATATGRLNTTLSDHLDTIIYKAPVIIEGQVQLVSSSADLDLFKIDPYQGFNVVESEKGNIQLYVKDTTASVENTLQTVNHTEYYVTYVVRYVVNQVITTPVVTLQPYKLITGKYNEPISASTTNLFTKDESGLIVNNSVNTTLASLTFINGLRVQVTNLLNTTNTQSSASFSRGVIGESILHTTLSVNPSTILVFGANKTASSLMNTTLSTGTTNLSKNSVLLNGLVSTETLAAVTSFVKDTQPTEVITVASSGQTDLTYGDDSYISRTETMNTALGSMLYRNNPGLLGISNILVTANINQIVAGANKTAIGLEQTLNTAGLTNLTKENVAYPTQTLITQGDLQAHAEHHEIPAILNTAVTSGAMDAHVEHINISGQVLITSTLLGAFTEAHVAPVTITLNKNGGTGGTNNIVSVADFHITPTSITPPTRAHYIFNGYYTMSSGGIQRINSAGTYIALADDTYTTAATLYAQWTAVLYTITWKSYANTTLKTENLTYGSVSTAPTGTTDTAQYDYAWPKSSTTVTGDETITETRSTKSYTITWKAYSGATLKSETLLYGTTSTAPTGTSDTTQYDYAWPKNSTIVTGTETITETRTTKSYTVTWYKYGQSGGTYTKRETLLYGTTSTAPTGTADTAQYDYSWPKASTVVTGTESITETRTLLSYTITWYKYGQSGETYAKKETLTYGSTSTAPTGNTDTAQYDYSWPKASTTVVGTESITETRAVKSYTITWRSYANATLKTETLAYGSISTAPIGTTDTAQYDYSWPKASTTVVGAETITETRVGQTYTVTFNANGGGTPSPTSKSVVFGNTYGTLATVTRTNWAFLGWFTAVSGGTLISTGTTVSITANQTLYAHWNPTTLLETPLHTLATAGQSDVQYGMDIQISRTETTISALGSMQYENQTTFNITLNANGGTNGTPTSITGLTGQSITPASITPATRTNYTITGYWTATSGGTKYINADGTYNNLNSNTFVGAVTLYAQWTMNNAYFDYNPLPSTIGLKATISIGGVVQSTAVSDWYQARPANSLFKVSALVIPPGWNYSSYTTTRLTGVTVGGSGATTEVQGAGDMTQTAARAIAITVTATTYDVTVVQNSGTGSSASVSTYLPKTSATTITMTRGTRTNYRFSHWSISGANGTATVNGNTITIPTYTTSVQPYGDLTITANWLIAIADGIVDTTTTALGSIQTDVATPFTITLDKRSGSGGTSSITCVNGFYLDPTNITVPTRNGYTFNGYYTATSGGTQRINSAGTYVALTNTTYTSATTLYAQWSLVTYTLTNDRNSGTGGNNSATYNITTSSTLATLLGTVTRTGYTFAGWKWTSSSAGGWVNGTTYASNTNVSGKYATGTLQAQWTANSFVITLNANGGTAATNAAISVTYNTSIESFNANMVPTRAGYNFNGYYTAASGGTQRTSATAYTALTSTTYSAAATLYAQWTAKTYTVSFNANGGGTPSPTSKSVTYGGTYGTLATVSRTGYTFAGWFTAASGGTEITSASTVSITAAQTLYAHWDINYYTVTWKDWDGSTLKTEQVAYMSDGTPPTQPTRTGYTFDSWSGSYLNVSSNRTISATYNVNTYVLTISSITGIASQTVNRTSSPNGGGATGNLVNSALLYYGDVLAISATASTAYSASVTGSPVTVTSNIATSSYVTASHAPIAPDITYVSRTDTSLTFTVKNNNPYSARVYYEHTDTTPDLAYVTLNANTTSSNLTITGLTTGTTYTVYARSYSTTSTVYSSNDSFTQETVFYPSTPTIQIVHESFYSVQFTITNTSTRACDIYERLSSEGSFTLYGSLAAGATSGIITTGSLSANTAYTVYAYAKYGGTDSGLATKSVNTMPAQVKPTNNFTYFGLNKIEFTITNNNPYEAEVHYGLTSSTTSGSVVVGANATSGTLSITGLSANSGGYLYSRTRKDGVYSSTDSDYYITLNAPVTPTITYVSKTSSSITFTVKNNDNYPARIYYEHTDTTPDLAYVDLSASATSGNLTISSLNENTAYTIYARSYKDGVYSSSASITQTTSSSAAAWTYLGTSTRPYTLNASAVGTGKCPSYIAARTALTNSHPPQNYSLGTVAKVNCYANGNFPPPPICATFYYERT